MSAQTQSNAETETRNQEQSWNAEVIAEFRANGGEVAAPYPDPPPMLLLHTIGARSGREHIVAMRCLLDDDGDTLYVIASAHGSDRHPDWSYNVRANPDFEIEMGTQIIQVHASELHGAEREAFFKRQAARFSVFADYQARLTRTIPVFKLDLGQARDNPLMTVHGRGGQSVTTSTMPNAFSNSAETAIPTIGLFEMVLEVADLTAAEHFYHQVIGLPVVERWDAERPAVWLALGNEGFLGLWPPASGGAVAIHGGRGGSHVHFALRLPLGTLSAMRERLHALGYQTEERDFGQGNLAIYLDDPDGNVLELTERTALWGE